MRRFLSDARLWAPDDRGDRIKAHVLWLPQQQPEVLAYFARIRAILARYPDVISPVADEDLHMTIQKIDTRDMRGERLTDAHLQSAAEAVRAEIKSLEPFGIEIGPARASGSAAVVEVWPEQGPQDLYDRVRTGLLTAGLSLPRAEEFYWCHLSGGYGLQDTDTPALAARSDQLASDLGRGMRPGSRVSATISSVWLVWERQDPENNRYTFERLREIPLGRYASAKAVTPGAASYDDRTWLHVHQPPPPSGRQP